MHTARTGAATHMTRDPIRTTLAAAILLVACNDANDSPAADDGESSGGGDSSTDAVETTDAATTGDTATVRYYEEIKPLLDARCTACHTEGGIAPFSLTNYEDAAMWAAASSAAIHSGSMPPWPPAAGCNDYVGVREVSAEELALIDGWVDEQTPMGDPAAEGAPLVDEQAGLSRVDIALPMPESYAPDTSEGPDDYRCFVIDWPAEYTTTQYVSGFRAVPGNDAVVHHVIAFHALPDERDAYLELDAADPGPGYSCFGGTGGPSRSWLGGWAPGSPGSDLPPGLGLEVPPGSAVILQLHYNSMSSAPDPDLTSVEFKVDDTVEKVARVMPYANPTWLAGAMPIPAGDDDVMHEFQRDITGFLGGPQQVWAAALHMHQRGKSGTVSIERANGDSECLLQIDAWDFHWQGSYGLTAPTVLEQGDELRLECHFDNSAANQPVANGVPVEPVDMNWGEGTSDEMCLGVLLVAPA